MRNFPSVVPAQGRSIGTVACPTRDHLLPPGMSSAHAQQILREQLDLTATESVIASLLPFGLSVKELASETGRSASTVKGHLEHIARRTCTCSGRELAALVTAVLWWAASQGGEQT